MEVQNIIDAEIVQTTFRYCLFNRDELIQPHTPPPDAVLVNGITATFAFHPERLQTMKPLVETWLKLLPRQFQNPQHGWPFSRADRQDNGEQWTGFHQRMEQLFALATGLGLARKIDSPALRTITGDGLPWYAVSVS